jgi:hypothetical protein
MRAKFLSRTFASRKTETDNAFHVLIVYEDTRCGQRATDTYQRLRSQFGREFDFRISIWSFSVLQCARLNDQAVQDAIRANAIIIAANFRNEPPAEIKKWIDGWVSQKRNNSAILIALLHARTNQPEATDCMHDYFRDIATQAGMDFLMEDFKPVETSPLPPAFLTQTNNGMTYEAWGLND